MKTLLKLIFCLAIYVGIAFETNAQNIRVAGKVTAANGIEIAGVHIFDSIAKVGATSDINGIFSLNISQKATKLRFSHIAFETKYLPLTEKMLSDTITTNTIWMDVVLTQKIMELPAVEISDAKVEIAYKNSKQWILDYELTGADEFLLLLLEKNKKYLQLVNSNHEKISQIIVSKDYNELFKDCFGTFHLLSKDSACQIFLMDEKLTLPYHYTRQDFEQIMEPIVVNTNHYLYTQSTTNHGQVVLYDKIDKESKDVMLFIENSEENQATFNSSYVFAREGITAAFIKCNGELATPEITTAFQAILINSKDMDEFRRSLIYIAPADVSDFCDPPVLTMVNFYKQILSIPPYSLLAKINDTLYFFDHLNSKISIYNLDGTYIKETPINYHNSKGWDKEIIINEEKTRCFAKFTRNGETSLVEINPNTGQTMGRYVLETHAFPTKIRVRGNNIYYLSKDYFQGEEKYFLWKQKME